MIVRKFIIVVTGKTESDVEEAFMEVADQVRHGCLSGSDRNDESAFYFDTTDDVPNNEHPAF